MTTAIETYLGWEQPTHYAGCKRPSWSVDFRTDHDEFRARHGGEKHDCPNEDCDHGDRYARTTFRIVCPSCHAAVVIRGEDAHTSRGHAAHTTHGFGMPAQRVAGLLLWPGEPWLDVGRLRSDEPHDFVVTRPGVKCVIEADVVGQIRQGRGKRGGVIWVATALPAPDGKFGYGRLRFAHASDDSPLRSVPAAARWVAAQVAATSGGEER